MTDDTIENIEPNEETRTELEDLPMHALRKALKDKGIEFKNTDKKVDLIKMLRDGETKHKDKPAEERKRPDHGEKAPPKATIPQIPESIRPQLEEMSKRGLSWEIDKENCGITFKARMDSYTSLDAPDGNILQAAKAAFGAGAPIAQGRGQERREW